MPKSKRNQIVHLTQVKKKGKDHKGDLLKQLEEYVDKFKTVYLFDFDSVKSDRIMNLRMKLKDVGRIFSGKNSLVQVTIKSVAKKTGANYEQLLEQINGHKGLLFTDLELDQLMSRLDKEVPEFCKKLVGYSKLDSARQARKVAKPTGDETTTTTTSKSQAKKIAKKQSKEMSKSCEIKFVKV